MFCSPEMRKTRRPFDKLRISLADGRSTGDFEHRHDSARATAVDEHFRAPDGDGLYFFAETSPRNQFELPTETIRAALADSDGVPSESVAFVREQLNLKTAVEILRLR